MSKGIKAVLPWVTFVLTIILCAFLIYVAFFSYQAGKAPTVNKVEANITLILAIILAVLVGLLLIWSIIHLYLTNQTKTKKLAPETKSLVPKVSETQEMSTTNNIPEPKIYTESVTKPTKTTRVTVQPEKVYDTIVSDPGASSAMQDLLRSSVN